MEIPLLAWETACKETLSDLPHRTRPSISNHKTRRWASARPSYIHCSQSQAPQLMNIILKPLEVLTRSFLWRPKPPQKFSTPPTAGEAAPPAEAAQTPSTAAGPAAANPAPEAAPRLEVCPYGIYILVQLCRWSLDARVGLCLLTAS